MHHPQSDLVKGGYVATFVPAHPMLASPSSLGRGGVFRLVPKQTCPGCRSSQQRRRVVREIYGDRRECGTKAGDDDEGSATEKCCRRHSPPPKCGNTVTKKRRTKCFGYQEPHGLQLLLMVFVSSNAISSRRNEFNIILRSRVSRMTIFSGLVRIIFNMRTKKFPNDASTRKPNLYEGDGRIIAEEGVSACASHLHRIIRVWQKVLVVEEQNPYFLGVYHRCWHGWVHP